MLIIALNSPYLGGAERSIVAQAKYMGEEVDFLIPELVGVSSSQLEKYIHTECAGSMIKKVSYPQLLFSASRDGSKFKTLFSLFALPILIIRLRKLFCNYNILWANGNKIALPLFLAGMIFKFKGKIVWHFRDYPAESGFFKMIWKLFGREKFNLVLVGNSNDVTQSIHHVCKPKKKAITVYNPVGKPLPVRLNKQWKTIGCASMFAPWKGIHEVLIMANLYHGELKKIGIEKIQIFGGAIYATKGSHTEFEKELLKLAEGNDLIEFRGLKNPEEIFSEIDIMIHSSVKKEPFGRIVIESFKSEVPIVSTALGGTKELVINKETGLSYYPHHYKMLFDCIALIKKDVALRELMIKNAAQKCVEVESKIAQSIKEIILNKDE